MTRIIICLVACTMLACIADGHPAKPLFEPSPAIVLPPRPLAVNLSGTSWQGKYNTVNRIFIFEPDGTLSFQVTTVKGLKNPKVYKNYGNWRQENDKITFSYGNNPGNILMEFRGTLIDANTIEGEATYSSPALKGSAGKQTMKRALDNGPN
jgi:hypothetical protein